MKRMLQFIALTMLIAGCGDVHAVSADRLATMAHRDPLYHLVYVGSDEQYHYINRQLGNSVEHYRVPKSQLELQPTFPVWSGRSYILTDASFGRVEE